MANIAVLNQILEDAQNLRSKFHSFKNTATPLVQSIDQYSVAQMESVGLSNGLATKIKDMVGGIKRVGAAINSELNNIPDDTDLQ
jgi:hypothetical protein